MFVCGHYTQYVVCLYVVDMHTLCVFVCVIIQSCIPMCTCMSDEGVQDLEKESPLVRF